MNRFSNRLMAAIGAIAPFLAVYLNFAEGGGRGYARASRDSRSVFTNINIVASVT